MDNLIKQGIKVDCILTDIPQQITQNTWDNIIPFNKMWDRLYKLRRDKSTPIILFTNQPFTTYLLHSNMKHFKIMKYWQKDRPSGFLNAKRMPLKDVEEISVFSEEPNDILLSEIAIFYEKQCTYNPQMVEGNENHSIGKVKGEKSCKNNNNYGDFGRVNTEGNLKYPRQVLYYQRPHPPIFPTEKPVELLVDLINTYSNENDTILDFTMGSCSTGEACIDTNRNFKGIESNSENFDIGLNRIQNHIKNNKLDVELRIY